MIDGSYDPNQLQRLTQNITRYGTPNAPPQQPDPNVVNNPGFEHYPGRIESGITAIRGLSRIFSAEGRAERAEERADRIQRQINVARYIGNRIASPRQSTNPGEKIGWVGVHKRELGGIPNPMFEDNLGMQLMDSKRSALQTPASPNFYRPTTITERATARTLDAKAERARDLRREARWLNNSYSQSLNSNNPNQLSRSERKNMRKISKRIEKLDRKASVVESSFDRVAHSNAIVGPVTKVRLRHNRYKAAKEIVRQDALHPPTSRKDVRRRAKAISRLPEPPMI